MVVSVDWRRGDSIRLRAEVERGGINMAWYMMRRKCGGDMRGTRSIEMVRGRRGVRLRIDREVLRGEIGGMILEMIGEVAGVTGEVGIGVTIGTGMMVEIEIGEVEEMTITGGDNPSRSSKITRIKA